MIISSNCLPCIFIQFRLIKNGMKVIKILQGFSKWAVMLDALIAVGFEDNIKMLPNCKPSGDETDRPDTATDSDETDTFDNSD